MSDSSKSQTATDSRPEIELLLCCARLQMEAERVAQAFHLLRQSLDWEYLLKTAIRHGVMPLLYRQMSVNFADLAPADFMSRLHDHFYLNAAHNHLLTEELCRLLALFEEHGIPAVPYKGPALAQQVYGDVALRQFSDLDVLIQRKDVAKASALLRSQGFTSQHQLTPRQENTFLKIECEHMFTREAGRVNVDLHWDFAPRYFSLKLDTERVWHRLERIEIVGRSA